jgi:DnaD/phage-associated family protein
VEVKRDLDKPGIMKSDKKLKDLLNMQEIRTILDGIDRPIAFRRALVDLTGSVQAALFLSQAIYWQERATQKDGWWYKTSEDWEIETGLSQHEQSTARKKCRKYLSSHLRDIPARLYWRVNRAALYDGLSNLDKDSSRPILRKIPNQFDEKPQTSLAESQNKFWGKPHTSIAESANQVIEKGQASITDSADQVLKNQANINMYTESTSESTSEIQTENNLKEIKTEREVETEIETESETESETEKVTSSTARETEERLKLLTKSITRALPEENPTIVEEFLVKAEELFSEKWIREAVNEAAIRNKRTLKGILEILMSWKENGHGTVHPVHVDENRRLAE